jgi:hypothetical protein
MATSGLAVVEAHVFDRSTCILPTIVASVKGLYPRCASQLHFLDQDTVPALSAVMVQYVFVLPPYSFTYRKATYLKLPIIG